MLRRVKDAVGGVSPPLRRSASRASSESPHNQGTTLGRSPTAGVTAHQGSKLVSVVHTTLSLFITLSGGWSSRGVTSPVGRTLTDPAEIRPPVMVLLKTLDSPSD